MGSIGEEQLLKADKMQMAINHEEKILVLVRLRPLSEKEIAENEAVDWECINSDTILYRNTLREGSTFPSSYTFDRVFRGDCSTRRVYEEGIREVVLSVLCGINSSIFAYGQTSSGKTYTMMGITEYMVTDIFNYICNHEDRAFVLKFSAIEIYNEAIRDLLSTDSSPLRLLDDPEKITVVENIREEILKGWKHLRQLLSICEAQRRIGETSLNEKSSRSHQILRLTVESSAREFLGNENLTTLSATVNLVDLAGSERASQAFSSGARLKEGCHINRSLLTLGTVIRKLSKGRRGHVNYRDSKLTRLLQPALGGNAKTAIICTLSPAHSHVEQTRNTLLFACCAKEVSTRAQINVVMSDKILVKHLQRELARLESELKCSASVPASSAGGYAELLRKKDLQIQKMEKEITNLTEQRDLAESRIHDLLQMIGNGASPEKWKDECLVSESSSILNPLCCDENGMEVGFISDDDDDDDASSISFSKNIVCSDSVQNLEHPVARNAEEDEEYCREVECVKMEETAMESSSSLSNEEDGALVLTFPPANEDGGVHSMQNWPTIGAHQSMKDLADGSSSCLNQGGDGGTTRPNGLNWWSPDQKKWSTNGSRSYLRSSSMDDLALASGIEVNSGEHIPTFHTFVSELKQMAKLEYVNLGMEMELPRPGAERCEKHVKDVGLDPQLLPSSPSSWPSEFKKLQRAILELWHSCNVSLIHRTYFFLLFKGDPSDSIYLEVELRRLSFLKEMFSKSHSLGGSCTPSMASSLKDLNHERVLMSKLMRKKISREERHLIYKNWDIGLNSRNRRLQLANRLWTNPNDINHVAESAAVVAKLVRFVGQGQVLKEMFGLIFTPPSSRRRSFGWASNKSSLL